MKNIILLSSVLLLISSCGNTVDVKDHIQKPGDVYCTYNATGAGEGTFPICMYCPTGNALCGTISKVRILRVHHWFKPNEYDEFDLSSTGQGCTTCTGLFYWEKE